MINFSQRISIPTHVLKNEVGGESVLLNIETETYFTLNEIGTCIWELLSETDSIEAAYQVLCDEYDVQPEKIRKDLEKLLDDLVANKLIVVSL